MLDARAERTLTEVAEQLRTLCGERLLCVALYGSGASPDFVPGSSDLNLVVVLSHIDRATMVALRMQTAGWRKRRVATPLVVDRAFLQSAADVFPMELHDIKDNHRLLVGQDVFATLAIHDTNLRFQCEHEARSKLLRLRELYLEIGDHRGRMQTLMLDSVTTFLVVMRAMVRMHAGTPGMSVQETFDLFCQRFSLSLPVIAQLLRVKLGKEPWSANAEDVFHEYVGEVERLVHVVDQLTVAH